MLGLTPEEWTAVHLSLRISLVATFVSLPFGIAIAWLLARCNFWGKSLLDGVVHLPLVLPPVVVGYFLLLAFGRRGPIGAFLDDALGVTLAFRWTGAALASAVMGFPLLVRSVRQSLDAVDRGLEAAAATLGASPPAVFATVTLPLIVPGIIAAAMLSFALSLDDFIITYFVSGSTVTYPLYVNAAVKAAVPPQINVLATAILVVSLLLLAIGTLYRRKRIDV